MSSSASGSKRSATAMSSNDQSGPDAKRSKGSNADMPSYSLPQSFSKYRMKRRIDAMADLATQLDLRRTLKEDSEHLANRKAFEDGAFQVVQNFKIPNEWDKLSLKENEKKPSDHRPFADIIGDMVETGEIRITDVVNLTMEEALEWESKRLSATAENA
ncbi:hypothetical protein NHQ30_006913 [Ciborinia camelliae]|nr:hypothetical protein NHQ30_006913 [Ciborinia camelliae]